MLTNDPPVSEKKHAPRQVRASDLPARSRAPYVAPTVTELSMGGTEFKPSPLPGEIGTTTGS